MPDAREKALPKEARQILTRLKVLVLKGHDPEVAITLPRLVLSINPAAEDHFVLAAIELRLELAEISVAKAIDHEA